MVITVSSARSFRHPVSRMMSNRWIRRAKQSSHCKPVTFRYRDEFDPDGIPQFGLVAEEVEKVNPALVARDEQGKPYTVRYEAVNAMLLNEFLKEHRKVETQEATIAQQEKEIRGLTATLKAQAAQIQQVSDQLATRAPVPRVVAND